ncbi:diguanylate cyclase [Vibrio sp. Hep-1b-8]|nr:diguanylate cyclase [Vibrio sp. Hep-1b-8]
MALPKLVIRTLKPYIILLVIGMVYAAFQQLKQSEYNAYQQSFVNIKTASDLVSSQLEAASSKLFLLADSSNEEDFVSTAQRILKYTPAYNDIIYRNKQHTKYQSIQHKATYSEQHSDIVWQPLDEISTKFTVSSIYPKASNQWVFAVRYIPDEYREIWIEFDLKSATQSLRALRTLDSGYVFVVDAISGRLVFHPDPKRLGTPSISYLAGISELISSGLYFGKHEYYYQGQYKMSVFSADNKHNWVFIAGTDRANILATSYQFALSAIVIASLMLLAVAINYLTYQLNKSLAQLNNRENLADFKHYLKAVLDRFCHHKGMQLCFYDSDYGHFTTIDYHGNTKVVLTDSTLAKCFSPNSMSYTTRQYVDPLAKKLHIASRHYTIPLFDKDNLIAVMYINANIPIYRTILTMIRDYSEIALSNLILHQQLRNSDVMTHLDNKLALTEHIEQNIERHGLYLAMIDIDHFKTINDNIGHLGGDKVIYHTADLMRRCFPKPGSLSLSRYGGEEFCILFHANDENHAYEQCELLRQMVEQSRVELDESDISYTISIGITDSQISSHSTISRADKALYQAKGFGRNQVVLNTFQEC